MRTGVYSPSAGGRLFTERRGRGEEQHPGSAAPVHRLNKEDFNVNE